MARSLDAICFSQCFVVGWRIYLGSYIVACSYWQIVMTMTPNKSLQATRDGGFRSAIAGDVISPACLSSGR